MQNGIVGISKKIYIKISNSVLQKKSHNLKWPYIPNYPYRILILGFTGSGKTTPLHDVISHQFDIDKKYLNAEHPHKAKY